MGSQNRPREPVLADRADSPALLLGLLGQRAFRHLRTAHHEMRLSPRQFHVLGLLHDQGPLGQRALAGALAADPGAVVAILNPLEEDGFIERRRDAEDRRRHVVHLTEEGAAHLRRAAAIHRRAEDDFFATWPAERRSELRATLKDLRAALGDDEPRTDGDACGGDEAPGAGC